MTLYVLWYLQGRSVGEIIHPSFSSLSKHLNLTLFNLPLSPHLPFTFYITQVTRVRFIWSSVFQSPRGTPAVVLVLAEEAFALVEEGNARPSVMSQPLTNVILCHMHSSLPTIPRGLILVRERGRGYSRERQPSIMQNSTCTALYRYNYNTYRWP